MTDNPDEFDDLDAPDDAYQKAATGLEPEAYRDANRISAFEDSDARQDGAPPPFSYSTLAAALGCLALLVMFHAFQLSDWVRRDSRPPAWDQSIQLEIAKDFQHALKNGDWGEIIHPKPKPGMPPFPPLHYFLIQYAMDEANPAAAALWINLFYMTLLCASIFGIARRGGGEWGGLAAAALFTCMPEVQQHLREQLIDLALTAWIAAAYWALFASERFEKKIPSILFGLMFAAAMLTKWSAFSYFLPVIGTAIGASHIHQRNRHLMIAAAIVLVAAAPWYFLNWLVLLPRLIGASSDNSVPLLSFGGMFGYLSQMSLGMEFPFFAAGLVSLGRLAKSDRGREDSTLLLPWFILSLIFWMVVPNRQLRYLLPGLIPLAVLTGSAYNRKVLTGLCAFQLLTASNFAHGWVRHRSASLRIFSLSFFRSEPAKAEDWKLPEMIRKAAELHDPQTPFGNMALLANDHRFNGATFNWELDRMGEKSIRMRGINRRVCEFAEFLLTKTGELGPASVVNQLPSVRKNILANNSWFMRGYREAARWPLPDETEAVLYQRRKPKGVPVIEGRMHIDYLEEKSYLIKNLDVDFGRWDAKRGVYPRVSLRAESLKLRNLLIEDISIQMEELYAVPVENPESVPEKERDTLILDLRLLKMTRLSLLSAKVGEKSLQDFIMKRVPSALSAKVKMDDTLVVDANIHSIPLRAEAALNLSVDRKRLDIEIVSLRAWGFPVPLWILGPNRRYSQDLEPNSELPFEIRVDRIRLAGGKLRVGK